MKTQKILFILLLLSFFCIDAFSQEPDLPIKVNRLSERVAVFRFGIGHLGPNVSVVASDKGLIVIDTHLSNTIAEKFKKVVEKDMRMVHRSDFLIVHLFPDIPTTGTIHEMAEAWRQKKPVYLIISLIIIICDS